MYKNILVSTDGSELSVKAIRAAVTLAKSTGAKVTGVFVIAPFVAPDYGEGMTYRPASLPKRYKQFTERKAREALAAVETEARGAGVAYATMTHTAKSPWKGIINAAKSRRSDMIVMASHGRRGLASLVLGSETAKVLTHSTIPVLVCR